VLKELTFHVTHEEGNFQLVEDQTNSVVRVVTDDPLLTRSFWTVFAPPSRRVDRADAVTPSLKSHPRFLLLDEKRRQIVSALLVSASD
jgi:hypothetical protein